MIMKKTGNKIKKIEKNNLTFLEIKSEKGQVLNPTEVEAVTKNKIEGLLPLSVKEGRNSFKLTYNITGMKSLNYYLRNTLLNKQLFGFLLQNILNILKAIDSNFFQFSSLLMTFSKVKVEPSSKRLYFIYVPIQYYNNGVSLKEFLLDIIQIAQFDSKEDLSYVSEYLRILNTGVNFSVFELEEYINSITGKTVKTQKNKKCPHCGMIVSEDANFCSECQYNFTKKSVSGELRDHVYDPFKETDEDDYSEKYEYDEPEEDKAGSQGDTDEFGTSVLGYDEDDDGAETTVLNQPKQIVKTGYIKRLSNNEKKEINKGEYLIGRSLKCDFSIPDNSAVGRRHAFIHKQEDHFYIIDNNSTNRTYLNGKVIPQNEKIELFNDTKIRLADENFVFNILSVEK